MRDSEDTFHLTPERAAEVVAEHAALCETLSNHPNLAFTEIPQELIETVMVHVMTCQDRIHHIDGLPTDRD